MYYYREKRALSVGSFFFIVLFVLVFIGTGVLLYLDKGRFWDWLPLICIVSAIVNLILLIVYLVRKSIAGYIFIIFFIIFLAGIILSSIFGPFSLNNRSRNAYEEKRYEDSVNGFIVIFEEYPNSRYAKEIAKDIAYTYYLKGNFEESLKYFQIAIEQKIVNPGDLETVKLLSELHGNLGDKYYNEKNYRAASENYLKAVKYFDFISDGFPDTNEAFIAKYKIPEYLHKIATGYAEEKMWDDAFKSLKRISEDFPESEYYNLSNDMLFSIYISKAVDLKNSGKFMESITSFLSVLDLPEEILYDRQSQLKFQSDSLFSGIAETVLIQSADNFFRDLLYHKAIFIYQYIFKNLPQSQEAIIKNYVDCKIRVNENIEYGRILQSDPFARFKKEGLSKISFENKTDYDLILYISGPNYKIIAIDKQTKIEVDLISGDYTITAELSGSGINPFYGKVTYEDGARYREIYQPLEENLEDQEK